MDCLVCELHPEKAPVGGDEWELESPHHPGSGQGLSVEVTLDAIRGGEAVQPPGLPISPWPRFCFCVCQTLGRGRVGCQVTYKVPDKFSSQIDKNAFIAQVYLKCCMGHTYTKKH